MLKAYLDDSGTQPGSPAVVVGGLLGLAEDWIDLETAWRARLASPLSGKPPLKAFSLEGCVNLRKPFKDDGYAREECESLRGDFRTMIISSGLFQLAYAIPPPDWDAIVVPPYREYMGTAEEACFFAFIDGAVERVRSLDSERVKIDFVYVKGRGNGRLRWLAKLFELSKDRYPQIGQISFEPVAAHPGLQAADTIATEHYWGVQKFMADGNLSRATQQFKALANGMPGEARLLDRDRIQAEVARRGPDGRLPPG
jgi:hypothetical protein